MLIHFLFHSNLESRLRVTKFSAGDPTVFRNLLDILENLKEPVLLLLSLWETLKDCLWTWHNNSCITIYLIEIAPVILINMSVLLFSNSRTGVVEMPVWDNVKIYFLQCKKKDWGVLRESIVIYSSPRVLVISCI